MLSVKLPSAHVFGYFRNVVSFHELARACILDEVEKLERNFRTVVRSFLPSEAISVDLI